MVRCLVLYAYVHCPYCLCASLFSRKILQGNGRIKTLFLNYCVAKLNMHLPLPLTHFLCTRDSIPNGFILPIIALYYRINLHVSLIIIFMVLSISIMKTVTTRWFTRSMTTPIAKRLRPHQGRVSHCPSFKSPQYWNNSTGNKPLLHLECLVSIIWLTQTN